MDEAGCRDGSTLDKLRTLRESGEVVVLSLDTLAGLALRRMGVPYVTPDLFFKKEKSNAMDKQSVAFSTRWYKSLDNPLMSYHGVSIGEVLEYDFYFLFIDAVRSVEIANGLLRDSFDVIYMPPPDASYVGHSACYNILPSILEYLACQRGVNVVRLERPSQRATRTTKSFGWARRRLGLVFCNRTLLMSSSMFLVENLRALATLFLNKKMKRFVLTYDDAWLLRSLNNANGRGLKVHPDSVHTPGSLSCASRVVKYLTDERNTSDLDTLIVYDDIPLWRVLSAHINEMLSELVPSIVGRIQWIELLLRTIRPDSFAVLEDISTIQRSMCQVLRSRGIPVVVVQHGILTNDCAGFYVMPKVGNLQAVWGEYYRKWHTDRGKPAESQVVTGFPRHDGLFNLPPLDRDGLCSRFGLDSNVRVVLVATEWFQAVTSRYTVEDDENYIRLVLRSLKVHGDIQIVVKLHPGFQDRYHRIVSEIAEQEGVRVVIARDSLWDLVRLSSFVIVSTSSVCVEALILGKPVISVNLTDQEAISGLVRNGLAIGAYSEDEIKKSVRKCMEVDAQHPDQTDRTRQLLLPFIYLSDGCASKRVAELIRTKSL
jgi:hypothetical protein